MTEIAVKNKIDYIDIARGAGILLVVLGHCVSIPEGLNHFVFSVHMPLFFILSGFTFSRKNCDDPAGFIKKNVKSLLVPYIISCVLIILIQFVKALAAGEDAVYELVKWTVSAIYGTGTHYLDFIPEAGIPITFIGALWFLLAMFFARIIMMLVLKTKTPFLWVTASFFLGYVSARKIGWLPFSFQAGMCAVLFLYIGFVIKEKDLFRWDRVHWILKVLMALAWIYCFVYCGRLWMVSNTFSDGFLDIIGGISGTFVIVYISLGLEKIGFLRKIFVFLGRISLGIMCAHTVVLDCWPMSFFAGKLMNHFGFSYCVSEVLLQFAVTGVLTAVLFFIPWVNARLFPAYHNR